MPIHNNTIQDKQRIKLIVFDFDGVLTDNLVYVFEDGREAVVCNRADGLAFDILRKHNINAVILSTEKNSVVSARANKLKVKAIQCVVDKVQVLSEYCRETQVSLVDVMYVGNDLNDLQVMQIVGFPVAVADAHKSIKSVAKTVLATKGGQGVAREIVEEILGLTYT